MTERLLPPEEWPKLLAIEPFKTYGLPDPAHWRILVAEDEGTIVAVSGLHECVHNDPWWVHPAYRGHPTLIRRLWGQTKQVLDQHGVSVIYATVSDDLPEVQAMVRKLGYQDVPGTLYFLPVAACTLNPKE